MEMIPGVGGLVPTEAELAALDVLLNQDVSQVRGLVEVAELIAAACRADGEEIPAAVAVELAAVRRSGGVSAAERRAGLRTARRVQRAELRTLASTLDGARVVAFPQVTYGVAA